MLVHVRLAVLAFVVLAGCGYPALECDPDRAGELAFGYHLSGGFWASSSTLANGTEFLLIDGACQYWAHGARPSELVTGTLDAALLAEINDELLTGPWEAIDGVANPPCCDGAVVGLGRDEIRAFDATGLAGEFESLSATSHRWAERLSDLGTPVTDGPIRLELDLRPYPDLPASHRRPASGSGRSRPRSPKHWRRL